MDRKFWLISYDISNKKRLRRVAKILEQQSQRVQKSVFECWLTESNLKKMLNVVKKEIKPDDDSVRIYTLCSECIKMTEKSTGTAIEPLKKYYIV